MHQCRVCSKTFTTKGSLRRHEQNHEQTREFPCTVCQVSFRRQDLLTRHARIHDSHNPNDATDTLPERRRRSRTACNQCRQARAKCTGQLPCARCQDRDIDCTFSGDTLRTSVDHRVSMSSAPSPDSATHRDTTEEPADVNKSTGSPFPSEHDDYLLGEAMDIGVDMELPSTALSPDDYAWPWIHEDLFLRDDISRDSSGILIGNAQLEADVHSISQLDVQDWAMEDSAMHTQLPQQPGRNLTETSRSSIIEALVSTASHFSKSNAPNPEAPYQRLPFATRISSICTTIEFAFDLVPLCGVQILPGCPSHSLQAFLQLYKTNFWPLWPLIPQHSFDYPEFEPFLYLVMISIGAMYGGRKASVFGEMLHIRLRDELVNPLLDVDTPLNSLLSLAQARALTQAATIHLGHKRAFSYSQRLGAVLLGQARKMNIFSKQVNDIGSSSQTEDNATFVNQWVTEESRKRLAFMILRLEMHTSVLHCTRPAISGEEIDLDLPCSRDLWSAFFSSNEAFATSIRIERAANNIHLSYSDLVRIASDPTERLPFLKMPQLELLLQTFQEQVWSSCTAKSSLERLVSQTSIDAGLVIDYNFETRYLDSPVDTSSQLAGHFVQDTQPQSLDAHLTWESRRMKSLLARLGANTATLVKLRGEVIDITRICASGSGLNHADRTNLLSCLLVLHLSFLQLNAPLASIHQFCHRRMPLVAGNDDAVIDRVRKWANSESAQVAVTHAVNIFATHQAETQKPREIRASVNFLTMIGLFHSAAVIYAYASFVQTIDAQLDSMAVPGGVFWQGEKIAVSDLPSMNSFVKVVSDLNSAGAGRSSFSVAIGQLGKFTSII